MKVSYSEKAIPVLWSGEVVIIGGSVAGMTAALEFARAGKKTALVEPRTYLGRDLFATLRPWVKKPIGVDIYDLPELLQKVIKATGKRSRGGEFSLHPDVAKLRFEDILLEAGVKLIYASQPAGILADNAAIQGVVVGNKSGRQVLECQLVVDATETALLARLAGATFEEDLEDSTIFRATLEFYRTGKVTSKSLTLPIKFGIENNQVILHKGYRNGGHVLVEFGLRLPAKVDHQVEATRREYDLREKAIQVAAFLRKNVEAFREAKLTAVSHDGSGKRVTQMTSELPEWARAFTVSHLQIAISNRYTCKCPLAAFAGPFAGLWILNNAARLEQKAIDYLDDPVMSSVIGCVFSKWLIKDWGSVKSKAKLASEEKVPPFREEKGEIGEPAHPQRGKAYKQASYKNLDVPVISNVDVLVVGGGSSGALAGITAARLGVSTALVDMNPGLGGTGTYGGVDSYWCGYRGGVIPQAISWVNQVNDELGFPHMKGLVPLWKVEVKIHAFLRQAYQAGMQLVLGSKVIGVIVENKVVKGVTIATPLGPAALLGRVVIDATGDGDVAAFAGSEYLYGSERDHSTMWFAYHQVPVPGVTRNNFTSTVDICNVEDYTRAILSGRRRGKIGIDHDHMTYVAPRETRHIMGDEILTLNDHLLRRSWKDVVYIAFSNNDIKGQISSDWMRMGLIPPHLEVEVPYKALLPNGLENILVTGKAVSTTHDSLATIRMQSDMENLGAASATAAVMAVKQGVSPRQIDVGELQKQLVQMDLLPETVLNRTLIPISFSEKEIEELVESIDENHPLYAFSDMRLDQVYQERIAVVDVVTAGEKAIPLLDKALNESHGKRRVLLAQMLAMMGEKSATPTLIEALQQELLGGSLPVREHDVAQVDRFAPDQAAMPVTANLLYSLGMVRDRRALSIWQKVVDLLEGTTEEDITSQKKAIFHYVDAVCVGAEQLGDPSAIPILKQLHNYPVFHGQVLRNGFQANYLKERQAYLEVVLGRALARCGSADGLVILINFLEDARSLLAEQAHDELIAVTGRDFGKDVKAWTEWLEAEGDSLKPVPWNAPTEAQTVWGKEILTTKMKDPRKAFGRARDGYQAIR
jgi:flavin-dependent dehydrogenase